MQINIMVVLPVNDTADMGNSTIYNHYHINLMTCRIKCSNKHYCHQNEDSYHSYIRVPTKNKK